MLAVSLSLRDKDRLRDRESLTICEEQIKFQFAANWQMSIVRQDSI